MKKCGILVDSDRPYLGCSPDGLVGTDRVAEVKCPYSAKDSNVSPESVPYLELDDQTGLLRLSAQHNSDNRQLVFGQQAAWPLARLVELKRVPSSVRCNCTPAVIASQYTSPPQRLHVVPTGALVIL